MRIQSKSRWKNKKFLIPAVVGVFTVAGLSWYFVRPNPAPAVEAGVVTYSTDAPAEEKPGDDYEWRGGPDDPKFIKLPTIETEGYIQNVGVDQNQEVAVPDNIHIAGWFVDSVRPGQTGLSIIDGHVDGRYSDAGIFKRLGELKEGDEYIIEMGDGGILNYRVKNVVDAGTEDAANVLFSQDPSVTSQLNLITCGGNFDRQSRQYDKRVIVTSELIN